MAVLGTTVDDPYFYQNKARQAGQAIGAFVNAFQTSQAERERREQEEIDHAFKAMAAYPELADTWGNDLVRKYGQKYPQIPQIIAVVKQRKELAQELPSAENAYHDTLARLEREHQAQQENVARMPDAVKASLPFGNPFGGGLPREIALPNPDKAAAMRAISEVRPELFPNDALRMLPPRQRDLARESLKSRGVALPEQTAFDPYKHLGEKPRGQYAVERGEISPESETAKIIRTEGELELSEAEKKKQDFQRTEREKREAAKAEERTESDRLMRERMELQDTLSKARINQRTAAQKGVVAYRKSFGGGTGEGGDKSRWKAIVKDSEVAVKDWNERKKAALAGLTGSDRIEERERWEKANPQPTALSQMAARRIARATEGLDEQAADDKALEMSAAYMQAKKKGVPEAEAIKRATGESKEPPPQPKGGTKAVPKKAETKQLFTEVKDAQAKSWATEEYMARLEAGAAPDEAKAAVDALLKQYGKVR